eukprot:9493959-Pyramimonas_sp.AAC.1
MQSAFIQWTNQTQEAWVYSPGGPIRRRKRGCIPTNACALSDVFVNLKSRVMLPTLLDPALVHSRLVGELVSTRSSLGGRAA